jgi:hypothetical protein
MDIETVAAHIVAGCVGGKKVKGKRGTKKARNIAEFYWELVHELKRASPREVEPMKRNPALREAGESHA